MDLRRKQTPGHWVAMANKLGEATGHLATRTLDLAQVQGSAAGTSADLGAGAGTWQAVHRAYQADVLFGSRLRCRGGHSWAGCRPSVARLVEQMMALVDNRDYTRLLASCPRLAGRGRYCIGPQKQPTEACTHRTEKRGVDCENQKWNQRGWLGSEDPELHALL